MVEYTITNKMKLETELNIRFPYVIAYGIFLSGVFFALNLTSVNALFFVGLALLLYTIWNFSEKELFIIFAFFIPNLDLFKYPHVQSAVLGYYFMLVCLKYLYKHAFETKVNIFLIAHFGICCLSSILWDDSKLFFSAVRFAFNFYLFANIANSFQKKEINMVLTSYVIGCIMAILFGIIYHSNLGSLFSGYFAGINSERNYFTAMISPMFSIILLMFMEKNMPLKQNVLIGCAVLFYFICFILSASRTAVISLAFSGVLLISYFPFYFVDFKTIKKITLFGVLLIVAVLFVFYQYGDSLNHLFDRFTGSDFEGGNGRFNLWKYYFDKTTSNWVSLFIGNGASAYESNGHVEHNVFIQCFYQTGILGLFSFLGIYVFSILDCLKKERKVNVKSLTPLAVMFFCFSAISVFQSDQVSFLFVLSLLIVKYFSNPYSCSCRVFGGITQNSKKCVDLYKEREK